MTEGVTQAPQRLLSGIAVLVASGVSVALGNTFIPVYYAAGGNAATIMASRYASCILITLGLLVLLRRPLCLPVRQILPALASGAFFGASAISVVSAFQFIPVGVAILLFFTFPVLTTLLQAAVDRRSPGLIEMACLIAALAGVGLTVGLDEVVYDPWGLALALLASCAVSVAFMTGGRALESAQSLAVSTFVALGGLGTALAFAAFGTRGLVYELADGGWQAFTVVVTASAIAFLGLIVGMKLVGAVPAAMLSNLEVVFTIVFATRILGEALTPMKLTGAAIIIGAVLVAQAHGWRKQRG